MRIPRATYRLQFHSGFTLKDAQNIVPYLAELGISHIYASPIFAARPGSVHCYDVVDHNRLHSEIGTLQELEKVSASAVDRGLSWLQDFVPNHMAYDAANPFLFDVLEKGPASQYGRFFDIDWNAPEACLKGRILAPFLGSFYAQCLERNEIRLILDEKGFGFAYFQHRFPFRLDAYPKLLRAMAGTPDDALDNRLQSSLELLARSFETGLNLDKTRQDLIALRTHPQISRILEKLNGTSGLPESFEFLHNLLRDQFYFLAFWKTAAEEINYRRFFVINDLISLRSEEWDVFAATHAFLLRQIKAGVFAGIRVDHVDGLHDPKLYLDWLRREAGDCYIIVEKILNEGERLPAWPIQGTTGYDFLSAVNRLFAAQSNLPAMTRAYSRFAGPMAPYPKVLEAKKKLILRRHMHGNLAQLGWALLSAASNDRALCDITWTSLLSALGEIMAAFPVYRTYVDAHSFTSEDRQIIRAALQSARESEPDLEFEIDFIGRHLLMEYADAACRHARPDFVMKFQQFTGPLMAKAFEDTFFYCYNKLVSLNEVGGSPIHFGLSREGFEHFITTRQKQWPHSLNATATHDTKRGEDARARINVLSEIPLQWEHAAKHWKWLNRTRKVQGRNGPIPDSNDEYFFYQNLIGAFPFEASEIPLFRRRMQAFVIKAIREAKVHTGWVKSNPEYEQGCLQFMDRILKEEGNLFWPDFVAFQQHVAFYGIFNSLSQLVLKMTCPGVPDIYQGTELWDFSLVDPDNRRNVDFARRAEALRIMRLREQDDREAFLSELLDTRQDGRIKMFVMHRCLRARSEMPDVFEQGDYIPLAPAGRHENSIVAFVRRHGPIWALVVVPRFLTRVVRPPNLPVGEALWHETALAMLDGAPRTWINCFTGQLVPTHHPLKIGGILADFPVALLIGRIT